MTATTTINNCSETDEDRVHRKRHAAKLRQRRCREKKRLATTIQGPSPKTTTTTAAATAVSRKTTMSDKKNQSKAVSPTTIMAPCCERSLQPAVPFPRLVQQQQQQFAAARSCQPSPYYNHHSRRHHHHHHAHARPLPQQPSLYPAVRVLPARYFEPQQLMRSMDLAKHLEQQQQQCSSPVLVSDDSIGSSSSSSSSSSLCDALVASPQLDTQEVAAITAMLSLSSRQKKMTTATDSMMDYADDNTVSSSESCTSNRDGESSPRWTTTANAVHRVFVDV